MDITNPFNEVYRADSIDAHKFVSLFCPLLINSVSNLFAPGNIVLKGTPGCGKSMLLSLFKPEIRVAYEKKQGSIFPLSGKNSKFIGAGINLNTTSAWDFNQRTDDESIRKPLLEFPLLFGDYINSWIIFDILNSLKTYIRSDEKRLLDDIGINPSRFDRFCTSYSKDDVFHGYLGKFHTLDELESKIRKRILTYKKYINCNITHLPSEILQTKTEIGDPINKLAYHLKQSKAISQDTNFFIRIDQYEELFYMGGIGAPYNDLYCQIINKAIASRSDDVSYRIGTRGYAWGVSNKVFGTNATLEVNRNYQEIDIDDILRRKEHTKSWIYPRFVEEVFQKRLQESGINFDSKANKSLTFFFGKSRSAEEKAKEYAGKTPEKLITKEEWWPDEWSTFLNELARESPLQAKMAEAWSRQRDKVSVIFDPKICNEKPWNQKPYWLKERKQMALMQIAGKCIQRVYWGGEKDIVYLSGGNISTFLRICRFIWEEWTTSVVAEGKTSISSLVQIPPEIQGVAIQKASSYFFKNISKEFEGDFRKRFILYLGTKIANTLYNDKAMSNPGYTGFSLTDEAIEQNPDIHKVLSNLVGFSDLHDFPHTTRTSDRKPRTKYYLRPIYCPYFRIPYSRTKEPIYISAKELSLWIKEAGELSDSSVSKIDLPPFKDSENRQMDMF